jgi:hypothetical protein
LSALSVPTQNNHRHQLSAPTQPNSELLTDSYPLQYGTLPHKTKSKPRPLQSRSGTLQRHKSSAEIYSKSSSAAQTSSLNRLLSISAEDIRRSLKETNDVIQRLLGSAWKKSAYVRPVEVKSGETKIDSSSSNRYVEASVCFLNLVCIVLMFFLWNRPIHSN